MKKNILVILFFLGCIFSLTPIFWNSFFNIKKNEFNILSMNQIFEKAKDKTRKGVLFLDISSPIFYQSGGSLLNGQTGVDTWVQQINRARENKQIKGLLLRIDSPGGGVAASEELYNALVKFRKAGKKIVVSIKSLCASGAYYISAPAHKIIANQGSIIGSIGVILSSLEMKDLYKKIGIKQNIIKSGKYKDILSPARAMTQEEKVALQKLIDSSYENFFSIVAKWRANNDKNKEEVLRQSANGMVYGAEDSKNRYLIDDIGDFDDAKEVIAELCGLDLKSLNLIYPKQQIKIGNTVIEVLFNSLKIPFIDKVAKQSSAPLLQYMYVH